MHGDGDEHHLERLQYPPPSSGGLDRRFYLFGDAPSSVVSFPSPLWGAYWCFGHTPLPGGAGFVSRAPLWGGFWFPLYDPDAGPSRGHRPGFVPRWEFNVLMETLLTECFPREGRGTLPPSFLFGKPEPFDQELQLPVIIPDMFDNLLKH